MLTRAATVTIRIIVRWRLRSFSLSTRSFSAFSWARRSSSRRSASARASSSFCRRTSAALVMGATNVSWLSS